jgi:hypothetical protein
MSRIFSTLAGAWNKLDGSFNRLGVAGEMDLSELRSGSCRGLSFQVVFRAAWAALGDHATAMRRRKIRRLMLRGFSRMADRTACRSSRKPSRSATGSLISARWRHLRAETRS